MLKGPCETHTGGEEGEGDLVLNLQSSTLLGPVGNGVLLLRCDSLVLITGQFSEATLECGLPVLGLQWWLSAPVHTGMAPVQTRRQCLQATLQGNKNPGFGVDSLIQFNQKFWTKCHLVLRPP